MRGLGPRSSLSKRQTTKPIRQHETKQTRSAVHRTSSTQGARLKGSGLKVEVSGDIREQKRPFVFKVPSRSTGGKWDSWNAWWIGPRQPICLELTAESPDGSERLQFWFRPWQTSKVSGDNCQRQARRWIWYNCVSGQSYIQTRPRWYVYKGLAEDGVTSLDEVYWSWDELIAVYGNWKLVATSTNAWPAGYKSAGWDNQTSPQGSPTCTATGKCLNFQVGARKGLCHIYGPDNEYQLNVVNWAGFQWGFRGNVDLFTLGIDLNGDGDDTDTGERINYDFEPSQSDPTPDIVSIAGKTAEDAIMGTMVQGFNNHYEKEFPPILDYYPVKISGPVTKFNNACFEIEDGSYLPFVTGDGVSRHGIQVWLIRDNNVTYAAPQYTFPATGQVWSAWGFLEKLRFKPWAGETYENRPWCLWTSYFNCQRLK